MPRKIDYGGFELIKELHKELDFSDSIYTGSKGYITFKCKEHGEQTLSVQALKRKTSGCPICKSNNQKYKAIDFIKNAKNKFGSKYDYSLIEEEYITADQEIKIKCNTCNNTFNTNRRKFISDAIPCRYCYSDIRGTLKTKPFEEFEKEAISIYGDKYIFYKTTFINRKIPMKIFCKKCQKTFTKMPTKLLLGEECQYCTKEILDASKRNTPDVTIKNVNNYLQHSVFVRFAEEYKNYNSKVVCKCNICNKEFTKTVSAIISQEQDCTNCSDRHLTEKRMQEVLINNDIPCLREQTFEDLMYKGKLRLDILLTNKNIAIEIQGPHHNRPFKYSNEITDEEALLNFKEQEIKDNIKREWCKKHNYQLIEIPVEKIDTYTKIEKWVDKNKSILK